MTESPFFVLSEQSEQFRAFVDGIEVSGGDIPENAPEAIALAPKPYWTTGGTKRRHAILVFSDAPALALGERARCPNHSTDLPKTLGQLHDRWQGTDQTIGSTYQVKAGRLAAFVPKTEPWTELESRERSTVFYSSEGPGLGEADIKSVIQIMHGALKKKRFGGNENGWTANGSVQR